MTNGWRRFTWEKILAGVFPELIYGRLSGITISGSVTPTSSRWPTGEIPIQMIVQQDGRNVHRTKTDSDGNFTFSNIFYKEYYLAEFSFPEDQARRNLRLSLNTREFKSTDHAFSFNTQPVSVTSRGRNWKRIKRPTTSMVKRERSNPENIKIHGNPDQVIYMQDLPPNYNNIIEVLTARVSGLIVQNGQIMFRGPSSIHMSNEPLFVIDGNVANRHVFLNLPPADVDRIEILRGASSAIYGIRGTNGVILAYTKRGAQNEPRSIDYMLMGFQAPREFSPSNLPDEFYDKTQVKRTLHWEPVIIPDEYGFASIIFVLNDQTQFIRVIVEGLDEKGNVAFREHIISQ
jgi:TonB-dependent SusC/RagA subfamily outer membrane receptor